MNVRIKKCGKSIKDDASILEILEFNGHNVEYQCREGYCGSCRTKLLEGDVRYTTEPMAFVRQGEILPCICTTDVGILIEV